jgi:hypothetical protein
VLVWDTSTGTVLRQLDIKGQGQLRPLTVAVSSSGDWIMCASESLWDNLTTYLKLWGPSNQEFSAHVKRRNEMRRCCVTINTSSRDRLHGAILCGKEKDGREAYDWALSSLGLSDPEIVITPNTAAVSQEDVASELKQASLGGSDSPLLQSTNKNKLHVRYAALDGTVRCTCKAVAVFDSTITSKFTWPETKTAYPGDRAPTSPKVAVGLDDGTVHFMELCSNNVSPL